MSVKLPLTELTAISPIDGRYRDRLTELAPYVSEYGLIKLRFEVEARYLVALANIGLVRRLTQSERQRLLSFSQEIDIRVAERVKKIESETRHDVKALEKTFRQMVAGTSLEDITEMIHFGLTSEDVNNLAYRLMLKRTTIAVVLPVLNQLIGEFLVRAQRYKAVPMLARTHGQPAVPTTVGKEIAVFASRLNGQTRELQARELTGKLTGAVGNLNALHYVYPEIDWIKFSADFVKSFGFVTNQVTTQINPYEDMIAYFQNYQRINGIIIDFDQDMWRYISDYWFVQEVKKGEVGSSTMPQKVNPIDFENSEGNLNIANALLEALSRKLSASRLQRDLSDSTTVRNIGTALANSLIGYKSTLEGLGRVRPNKERILAVLNTDWSILTEAIQTVLRKEGVRDSYSLIASLSRGESIDEGQWKDWLENLAIDDKLKKKLANLSPETYIGLAVKLTERAIKEIGSTRKK